MLSPFRTLIPTVNTRLRNTAVGFNDDAEHTIQHSFSIHFHFVKKRNTTRDSYRQELHLFHNAAVERHSNRQPEQLEDEQVRHLQTLLHQNCFSGLMPITAYLIILENDLKGSS